MPDRQVTPSQRVNTLLTGHFKSDPSFYAYRPRGSDDYLLIYTKAGTGRFAFADGRMQRARAGDLVLIAPGTFQDYATDAKARRWEILWAHFRPRADWLDLLNWPEPEPGVRWLSMAKHPLEPSVHNRFLDTHRQSSSTDPLRDRLAMNALEMLLLTCERANPVRASHAIDVRVRQVMDYVARNLSEKITLDRLAELSGLSTSRLSHRFREVVGASPMSFVEQQRTLRATQLLTMTSLNVKQIAVQLGYDTPFYFSLRFKKQTGRSPTDYRRTAAEASVEASSATSASSSLSAMARSRTPPPKITPAAVSKMPRPVR